MEINLLLVRTILNLLGLGFVLGVLRHSRVYAAICLGMYFLTGILFRIALVYDLVEELGIIYQLLVTLDLIWIVLAAYFIMQGILLQVRA